MGSCEECELGSAEEQGGEMMLKKPIVALDSNIKPIHELVCKDHPDRVVAYACGACGIIYQLQEDAVRCHGVVLCSECGVSHPSSDRTHRIYSWTCDACRNKAYNARRRVVREKAEQVSWEDYDGPVWWEEYDKYEDNMSAMLDEVVYIYDDGDESIEQSFVEWAKEQTFWCCDSFNLSVPQADSIIEGLLEDHHEDAELDQCAYNDLQAALDGWYKVYRNKVETWEPNEGKRLVVSDGVWLDMGRGKGMEDVTEEAGD